MNQFLPTVEMHEDDRWKLPKKGRKPRGKCPSCLKSRALREDGLVQRHHIWVLDPDSNGIYDTHPCPGSHEAPVI